MKDKQFEGFFKGILPDSRIEKRAEKIMVDMLDFGNVVVNKFCPTHTDRIGAYRMLGNNIIDYNDLANGLYRKCKDNQHSGHLLCIEDTTEINFSHHMGRIGKEDEDIGPVTKDINAGFFCHPVLVIDPSNQLPIGISFVEIWNRSWDNLNKYERNYHCQDIKEKESYRWIAGAQETKKILTGPSCLTIIGDRESDIYDEFISVPDQRTHLLIRSKINRRLWSEDKNLFEKLDSSEQRASYELEIKHNPKRAARKAKMSLKYEKLKIRHPKNRPLEDKPPYVEMWAIEVKELPGSVPYKEEPILWRLLTTHPITCVKDALKCTEWYSQRWLIEELFRVLKSKGLTIEASQLETGAGLKKLAIIALQVALTTMTLKLSLSNNHKLKANLIFSKEQIHFLSIYMQQLEGNTDKLRNPYKKGTLQWSAWGIARVGGWSGYISQGPPGYITIKEGFNRFLDRFDGFRLAYEYLKERCV
jgi:Transposase DDE domain